MPRRRSVASASIRRLPVTTTIDLARPVGARIARPQFERRPVAPTDTFTMALNNYRQTGGGGFTMFADAPLIDDPQEEIRQILID